MTIHPEYPQHRADLKKCEMLYNILGKIYLFIIIFLVLAFVPNLYFNGNVGVFLILALLLIPAEIALDMMSIYRKETKFTFLALIPAVLGLLCVPSSVLFGLVQILLFILAVVCALLVPAANKKYNYLAQQEGFPYFNELHTDNRIKADEALRKDPYERDERFYAKQEVRGVMDDFVTPQEEMKARTDEKNDYMDAI